MLRYYAGVFINTFGGLDLASQALANEKFYGDDGRMNEDADAHVRNTISLLNRHAETLTACASLRQQIAFLQDEISTKGINRDSRPVLEALIRQLRESLAADFESHVYFQIPVGRRNLIEPDAPLFGHAVQTRYPGASRDIAAAGRCLALDEWTAAVFHLMRVVEYGLKDMARRLRLPFPRKPLDFQEMGTIIAKLEEKIEDLRKGAGSHTLKPRAVARKLKAVETYSKAAQQFWFFKEAWRNHVMHARATYDEAEAFKVYEAVKHFMQELALRP